MVEIDERVVLPAAAKATGREPRGADMVTETPITPGNPLKRGTTGEVVEVREALDEAGVREQLQGCVIAWMCVARLTP